MALAQWTNQGFDQPAWSAEQLTPEKLMPGGSRLVTAEFAANADGARWVESGRLVGRTFAERTAGNGFGVADVAADEEIFITAFDVLDCNKNPDVTLLRHGTLIYEDKLPIWATATAPQKAKIRALYQCVTFPG